jgi:hypothetical protein
MTNTSLAKLGLLITFSVSSCSLFVNADRSEVKDNLYEPSDAGTTPDAAEPEPDAGEPSAGAAGAGAGEDGGAAGAPEVAGAGGEAG